MDLDPANSCRFGRIRICIPSTACWWRVAFPILVLSCYQNLPKFVQLIFSFFLEFYLQCDWIPLPLPPKLMFFIFYFWFLPVRLSMKTVKFWDIFFSLRRRLLRSKGWLKDTGSGDKIFRTKQTKISLFSAFFLYHTQLQRKNKYLKIVLSIFI